MIGRPVVDNPFAVLGLMPTATAREVEREAAKWLGMLELGLEAAGFYTTPLGRHVRTAEGVRAAAAALREPRQRLIAEQWAASQEPPVAAPPSEEAAAEAWSEAFTGSRWLP